MTWAANHDASIEKLQRVQGSLTVGLIMVDRQDFMTCKLTDRAQEVKDRNTLDFSFLPVVNEFEKVIGLYNAERWFKQDAPSGLVGDEFNPLSEDIIIGADASIFDFIRQADTNPTNLVVSGNRIAGLVSLSDLQQLPVRSALFALITSFEMAMALAIERTYPTSQDWMAKLSDGARAEVQGKIDEARKKDTFISEIAFTQLHDKAAILCKSGILRTPRKKAKAEFERIGRLRDSIAHANSFAESPEKAKEVCQVVRSVYHLKEELLIPIETASIEG